EKRAEAGPVGLCQVTCEWGPIATTHSIDIKLPLAGSHSKGVKVVSNNKDAFKSYGLEDSANACIGWRGAEGYGRAIQHLLHGVPGRRSTLTVGPNAFLFWTRDAAAAFDAGSLLDNPDAESVARLLESPAAGRPATADPNDFYCLVLSGNAAR